MHIGGTRSIFVHYERWINESKEITQWLEELFLILVWRSLEVVNEKKHRQQKMKCHCDSLPKNISLIRDETQSSYLNVNALFAQKYVYKLVKMNIWSKTNTS